MMNQSLNHAMVDGGEARIAQEYANSFGQPGFDDPSRMYIRQQYDGYTEENQETWVRLCDQQQAYLEENASQVYLDGARAIKLVREHIPHLDGEQEERGDGELARIDLPVHVAPEGAVNEN